ncbi:MAG: hypothetical protein OEW15_14550 [Nitrospirota bacterium]|nr:hypothetical protein [Nitrospirota bacterium]
MFETRGSIRVFALLCAGLFLFALSAGAGHDHDAEHKQESKEHKSTHGHGAPAASKGGGNPLIEEMQILDGVFRDVVSAVSLGDGQRVYHALHSMHGTMEKTHEGVHHGTVKLTKNADKLETFVKMDKEFHGELENLAAAAKKNDQQKMLTITKGLLDGCVRCHGMFK